MKWAPSVFVLTCLVTPTKSSPILNGKNVFPPLLILACNRLDELRASLFSISRARLSHKVDVYLSLDCPIPIENNISINLYPFRSFSVLNSYQRFSPKNPWTDERVARHWLSAINTMLEHHESVIYLEEDHVVMPDFFEAALYHIERRCPGCFEVNLGCHPPCQPGIGNIAVVYFKNSWDNFVGQLNIWCSWRGDWDHNLRRFIYQGFSSFPYIYQAFPSHARHLHDCVSARTGRKHFQGKHCGFQKRLDLYESFVEEWAKSPQISSKISHAGSMEKFPLNHFDAPNEMKKMCKESIRGNKLY